LRIVIKKQTIYGYRLWIKLLFNRMRKKNWVYLNEIIKKFREF
jgi:hypothetical protein